MTPKFTATASTSGSATSSPPSTERRRSEAIATVMSAIWRMLRSLPWTMTSAAAALEASEPV